MNHGTHGDIILALSPREHEALARLAHDQLRAVAAQARHTIRAYLILSGYLDAQQKGTADEPEPLAPCPNCGAPVIKDPMLHDNRVFDYHCTAGCGFRTGAHPAPDRPEWPPHGMPLGGGPT